MLHRIPHAVSEGLRKENDVHDRDMAGLSLDEFFRQYPTVESYAKAYLATAEGRQVARAFAPVPAGKRVLDIGAGLGRSTLFLASHGYQVVVVEPSLARCEFIDRLAKGYGCSVEVCHANAEAVDRLPFRAFDVCLFNASLHHCDDPAAALRHCRNILCENGRIFLLNEPQLHSFRSHRWFAKQLGQQNLVTGDYGGNEHIYYHREYLDMLRQAGFAHIQAFVSNRYHEPESYLRILQAEGRKGSRIVVRRLFYRMIRCLQQGGGPGWQILSLLQRLSLVQSFYTAWRLPEAGRVKQTQAA